MSKFNVTILWVGHIAIEEVMATSKEEAAAIIKERCSCDEPVSLLVTQD